MKIITLIIAVAKAVPIVNKWVEELLSAWTTYQISKIEGPITERSKQRKVLMNSIAKAESDEERLVLSVVLHKLNHGELQKSDTEKVFQ